MTPEERVDRLLAGITEPPPTASRAAYMRDYRAGKSREWKVARYRRGRALDRAQRKVANAHPEELAAVLLNELKKEGLR